MDNFIMSQLPFLFGVIAAAIPMAFIHFNADKPRFERLLWSLQAILWLLIGVGASVLYYSIDYIDLEPWNYVATISFITCAGGLLISFIIYVCTVSYRRKNMVKNNEREVDIDQNDSVVEE